MSELDEETVREIVRDELGGPTRREALKAGGALGLGSILGVGGYEAVTREARAGSNQAGTIGTSSKPVDVEAEDIVTSTIETDTLDGADLANAAAGEVPESDGAGGLQMASVGGDRLTTDQTDQHSGASSVTYTLNSNFDIVFIVLSQVQNATTNNDALEMDLNGDTGTNYDVRQADGTLNSGTGIPTIAQMNDGSEPGAVAMRISGRWSSVAVLKLLETTTDGSIPQRVQNDSVTSPLDSVTLSMTNGNNFSADVEILGVNIP